MLIGTRVKQLCKERGMSVAQLEKMADIQPKSISKWDKNIPSFDKVWRVIDAFGISFDEFLYNKKPATLSDDGNRKYFDFMDTMDQLSSENLAKLKDYVLYLQHQQTVQDESK